MLFDLRSTKASVIELVPPRLLEKDVRGMLIREEEAKRRCFIHTPLSLLHPQAITTTPLCFQAPHAPRLHHEIASLFSSEVPTVFGAEQTHHNPLCSFWKSRHSSLHVGTVVHFEEAEEPTSSIVPQPFLE
jgi:hypothetical protein